MKKIMVLLVAVLMACPAFAQKALDKVLFDTKVAGSKQAQEKLNKEIFDLLKAKKYDQVEDVMKHIYPCPTGTVAEKDIPARCTVEMAPKVPVNQRGWSFISNVTDFPLEATVTAVSASNEKKTVELNVVVPDKALYYALTKYYIYLFGADPLEYNKKNYASFFKRFAKFDYSEKARKSLCPSCLGDSLADKVETTMVMIWQNGVYLFGLTNADGEEIFNTVRVATEMGVAEPLKYVKEVYVTRDPKDFAEKAKQVLDTLYGRSKETHNRGIFYDVKTLWWNNVLFEAGSVHEREICFLAEHDEKHNTWKAWETLAITPITTSQRKIVRQFYKECLEKNGDFYNCDCAAFRKNAIHYGYMTKSDKETTDSISSALKKLKLGSK